MGVGKSRIPRVVVTKIGLDGHNRGAYVVAHGLRDAGMEVIYTGIRQTAKSVARIAVQEDADVIGVSSMVGAHLTIARRLREELEASGATDINVIMGGIIPEEDVAPLRELGVYRAYTPGARIEDMVRDIHALRRPAMWRPEVPRSLEGDNPAAARLLGSRCAECGRTYFPARRNCPRCLDRGRLSDLRLPGQGALAEFAVAQVAPPGYKPPHAQGYVDLDPDGPRVFSLLLNYDRPEDLFLGQRMEMFTLETGRDTDGTRIVGYRFHPEGKAAPHA